MNDSRRPQLNNIPSPCKGCEKRYQACSMQCETYKEYKDRVNAFNEKKRNAKKTDSDYSSVYIKRYDRRRAMGCPVDKC